MASILVAMKSAADELLGFTKDGDSMPAQFIRKHIPICMMLFIGMIFYQYGSEKVATTDIGDNKAPLSGDLAHGLCWAKGGYLYRELLYPENLHLNGMGVGMPKNLRDTGFLKTHKDLNKTKRSLCRSVDEDGEIVNEETCEPFHVVYYRQHHWLYQVLTAIVVIMTIPFLLDYANTDRMSMQELIKNYKSGPYDLQLIIVNKYFSRRGWCNSSTLRMLISLIMKIIPMVTGILMTYYFDRAFDGRFITFIPDLYDWLVKEPIVTNDYEFTRVQNLVTPGDFLLPSVLMCDIYYTAYGDDANSVIYMRLQMEMNSNKTAQYWFLFICPLMLAYNAISILDVLLFLGRWLLSILKSCCTSYPNLICCIYSPLYEHLTARQVYLLESIRWSNKEISIRLEKLLLAEKPNRPPRRKGLLSGMDDDPNDIPLSEVVTKSRN